MPKIPRVDVSYGGHFCDKLVFFPWVPFIKMHMMINVSLDLLSETWT